MNVSQRCLTLAAASLSCLLAFTAAGVASGEEGDRALSGKHVIVIHGGGGVRDRDAMTPELEAAYRETLRQALEAGHKILDAGGDSISAVEAAIVVMEDSPLFNAGKGSSFNREGYHELDASIMDGRTSNAGAAGVVQRVKNPIKLARAIMDDTPHVMLAGEGALLYARDQDMEIVSPHYFWTERKWNSLQRRLERETPYGKRSSLEDVAGRLAQESDLGKGRTSIDRELFGTVGAAALDQYGNLAAGTSTGGRAGKLPGRVGDSPIIGAGTYANNDTLAASSTGLGEYVIRVVGTKLMSDLMEYAGLTADEAVARAMQKIVDMGGGVGVVAVDKNGGVVMRYSGDGMYRGYVREGGDYVVHIYAE